MMNRQTKWYLWLDEDNVNTYPGGMVDYESGIYRPTEWSKMRELWWPFYQVNVEQFVSAIYKLVSPIDDATPPGTYPAERTVFFVEPMQPVSHDLDIQWYLDDELIPGATDTTLYALILGLIPGTYALSVEVVDNTELVRDEDMREEYMTDTREWTLEVTDCFPDWHTDYDEWVFVGKPDCWCYPRQCHGDADGQSEGKQKYWVSTIDLDILIAARSKPLEELSGNQICADFDHAAQGKKKYRVSVNDLDILIANWNQANKPDPDCFYSSRSQQAGSPVKHHTTEEFIEWLTKIWRNPKVRKVIDEDAWLEFIESLIEEL